ncbi:zinc finger CCCH domain-containing protein 11A isoform X2 [Pristis pectinata]|uniref:zinc finger CCCH domain-containing protein 11A isoform X2 n=1 Tax=Pristis pectinata TaxID=685728 RepID=UPI00223CE42A|nr:zinc finger CCCH domain-containing protein 11A isoform X2 [Pristis pectinata]
MTQQGDDCYFYFYSTCAKGDNCLFRHCEAALGSETICTLWQEGRCFRQVCKFRHMEIDKRRSEIPCYWEKQPTGCTKLNCAFHHSKPRFIEGVFIPATKGVLTKQEVPEMAEEPMTPQLPVNQLQQPKIPIQSNPSPQVRGVMKLESSENVPSPTHPPVVINAADDDEDDDDQFSEEGEENKNTQVPTVEEQNGIRIISTKRQALPVQKDDSLDFGIKTLEQIKRKKSMKEKSKKMDEPTVHQVTQVQKVEQNRENLVIEKENVRTVFRTVTLSPKKCEPPFKRSLAERLGQKKMTPKDTSEEVPLKGEFEPTLKRNLSERLGKRKILAEDGPEEPMQKAQPPRSIRERLGLPAEVSSTEHEKPINKTEGSGEIRVKTLEEIRREKAAKRDLGDSNGDSTVGVASRNTPAQACTLLEEASKIIRTVRVKTTSESLLKKQGERQEETGKDNPATKQPEADPRKDKRPAVAKGKVKCQKASPDESVTKAKSLEQVRIKTLEEIRREKALRRQENQESPATQQPAEKPKSEAPPTRKRLLRITKPIVVKPEKTDKEPMDIQSVAVAAHGDSKESQKLETRKETPRLQNVQVKSFEEILKEKRLRQLQETEKQQCQTPGKEMPANKMNSEIQDAEKNKQPTSSLDLKPNNFLEIEQPAVKKEENLIVAKPEAAEPPLSLKVKPKLNVKPSVVKNSCPVRISQKRKSPDNHPSTVMAVKPLNTMTTDLMKQPSSSEKIITSGPSPVQEEERTALQVPERSKGRLNLGEQSKPTSRLLTGVETFSPPRLSAKARRLSSTTSRSAVAEDDFEELMKEFSDDKLEAEIDLDPGKDEDDLLLELSEMIDS